MKNTSQFQEAEPIWMDIVKNTLKLQGIPVASRNTFTKFFIHLPKIIGNAFTKRIIDSGWNHSGLYPLDVVLTLNKITKWEYLTSDEGKTVLAAVRNLVPRAQLLGVVTDEEISNELRELNIPRREISSIAINAQRALWLNQDGVLLLRLEQEEVRRLKQIEQQQAEQRRQQRETARRIAAESASEMSPELDELTPPDDENFPIKCARSSCRHMFELRERQSRKWFTCPLSCGPKQPWFCELVTCKNEGKKHIRKCIFNRKVDEQRNGLQVADTHEFST